MRRLVPFILLTVFLIAATIAYAEPTVTQAVLIESVGMYRDPEDPESLMGNLDVGTEVTVLELDDNWAEIEYKMRIGYISGTALAAQAAQTDAAIGITMLGRTLYVCEDTTALALSTQTDIDISAGDEATLLQYDDENALVFWNRRLAQLPLRALSPDAECCYPFGAQGDSVAPMQSRLEALGFYDGVAHGTFDMETAIAVIRFRTQIGFTDEFLIDEYTYECLYADDAAQSMIRIANMRLGDTGNSVGRLQTRLISKGYLKTDTLGHYDGLTLQAVWLYQTCEGFNPTGEADAQTLSRLFSANAAALPDDLLAVSAETSDALPGAVVLADWFESDIQNIFAIGSVARIVDLQTGFAWNEMRRGGYNHADVQPLTAEDTALFKLALGGQWSWERRPIWVIVNGVRYAASMNGMPHGQGSITGNNFDGHHCIHFLNSRTHGTNSWDERHQACVQIAAQTTSVTLQYPQPSDQQESDAPEDWESVQTP